MDTSDNGDMFNIKVNGACYDYTIRFRVTQGGYPYNSQLRITNLGESMQITLNYENKEEIPNKEIRKTTITDKTKEWKVDVYNAITNQKVYSGTTENNNLIIHTNNWTAGVYIVNAMSNEGFVLTDKVSIH